VNILFVNYGDFTTNSLNHIGGFANALCAAGHACAVVVPHGKETIAHVRAPLFVPATYAEALEKPGLFPDGKTADLIHAWTPREGVRKFVLEYQRASRAPARLLIHLEDNERFLLETYTGKSFAALEEASPADIGEWLIDALPDPVRHQSFLRVADGVTHIIDRLKEFVPAGTPTHLLFPGVDFTLYRPQPADAALRQELGLRDDERVLVFTGSNTFANEPEMRELYLAVALLNQRGTPTRLIRTGFNRPEFLAGLAFDYRDFVLDLGFVEKAKLPRLLALADVLVQPGRPGPFNDYRLPSKLPEFLAMGRAVVLPPTNLARLLHDGREAVFLTTGAPEEIADTCERLFADAKRCATLGQQAVAFAHAHFDLTKNTRELASFYAAISARPPVADWSVAADPYVSEASLIAAQARASADAGDSAKLEAELALVARLVRQLEVLFGAGPSRVIDAEREHFRNLAELTQQHVRNLEPQLEQAREHAAGVVKARDELAAVLALTRQHAENLHKSVEFHQARCAQVEKSIDAHQARREQAEALLRSARQQILAFENALHRADGEIAGLRDHVAVLESALADARKDADDNRAARAEESAAHEAQLAAERQAWQQQVDATMARVTQAEAVIRAREEKLAKLQSSFSWQVTAPLRALRRAFLDRPAPPPLSDQIIGNIDYPQDWSMIPPTLNIRGWSLHRDRQPLQAVRARLGEEIIPAEFGLERLDVLDHFRDYPGAERCGWILKVETPRFRAQRLTLEAQDAAGAWHAFHIRDLKRTAEAPPPPPNSYAAWVAAYDSLTPDDADRIRTRLAGLQQRPLISVIMPVYNTPEKWLVRAIESVRRQLYDNWELCIADDASKEPHVRAVLTRYQKKDARIKVVFRETNGHISATSNDALALAQGEFIALLDHDDEIRPHALACVALEIEAHPKADLIYSDEDKIDENGHRYDHYFKPDWNPDLFNVQNYVSHLGVYRTLLVREVGGFRVGYEGSQDWDLAMRVIERTAPERIRHIPKILYHWRSVPGSTAMLIGAKNYAVKAAEKVITEHFARTGVEAKLTPTKGSYWRVHYPIPDPAPFVSLIIPTRNRLNVLQPCVESILAKTTYANFELLIVDNDSDDPATLAYLRELERRSAAGELGEHPKSEVGSPKEINGHALNGSAESHAPESRIRTSKAEPATLARVRVLHYAGEFNFSAINNYAVAHTDAPVVGLINNDLEVINDDWLDEMVSHALRPEIGCVGAKLYYPNDRIQHAGVILGIGGVAAHAWQSHPRGTAGQAHRALLQQNMSAVTAACLVIRREVFQQVGGLDEDKLKVAFNDIDFCLKVRAAGYRNLWTPYAELYHHESASRGAEDTLEKRDRFRSEVEYMTAKWGDALVNDPAYNPNLTLTVNDFTLALPPRKWAPLD
jgi:glycosyltransferase involved in cell wall biosynthesis